MSPARESSVGKEGVISTPEASVEPTGKGGLQVEGWHPGVSSSPPAALPPHHCIP